MTATRAGAVKVRKVTKVYFRGCPSSVELYIFEPMPQPAQSQREVSPQPARGPSTQKSWHQYFLSAAQSWMMIQEEQSISRRRSTAVKKKPSSRLWFPRG